MSKVWILLAMLPILALGDAQPPPKHVLFQGDQVHEIYLEFAQPDWYQQLLDNFNENEEDIPFIEASFTWNEYHFDRIGIRIKGNSTARVNSVKKPFRIKLNEFVKGQKIGGIDSLNFNNMNGDASMVREKAYYELAEKAGLTAPRMNWAALYINGEYWGLYFLGEVITQDFIDMRFPKGERNGWLYKGDIGSTFEDWGADKAPYARVFEKKTHEDEDDWSDLTNLVSVLNQTPKEELAARISEVLDVDSVLTALALDNLTLNMDSYVVMTQNFYIYRRETDNKFQWLVWDPSLAFGSFPAGTTAQMKVLPLEYVGRQGGRGPGQGGGGPQAPVIRPLATKLWEVPEIKARYREIYARLVQQVFNVDEILARMNTMREIIRPWAERDTNKLTSLEAFDGALIADAPPTTPGVGGQPGNMSGGPGIEPLIRDRKAFVLGQLGLKP